MALPISIVVIVLLACGLALAYARKTASNWRQSYLRECARLHALDALDGGRREERFRAACPRDGGPKS